MEKIKKVVFAAILVALAAGIVELCAFVFSQWFADRITFHDVEKYLATDYVLKHAHLAYHPERGWDNNYRTPFGERPRRETYGEPYIATYGDSFVHCDGVREHQTWQHYLSGLLRRDVCNFGTGAYGPDQAYLKFLQVQPKVKSTIAILGLQTENINRILNVYRPFYYSRTGERLTKPRFVLRNRRLVLLPNPVACQEDIEKLKDLRFIISLGKHDHWYNRYNYPVKAFPYSRILFNKRMWRELISKTSGHVVDDINPRPWEDLWQDAETVDLMFAILEAFVRQCKTDGVVPILMVIPGKASVQSVLDTGEDVAAVRMIEEYCRRNGWLFINPVGGFVEHIRQGHPLSSLYTGHVSPTGNAVIADVVRRFLVEHGLFEESAPAGGAAGPP